MVFFCSKNCKCKNWIGDCDIYNCVVCENFVDVVIKDFCGMNWVKGEVISFGIL